ncbi:NAD(P)-binding oxidoreductase [uncultured Rothia sp.]|uniref:NAD(P)-dependent oxidoreductase n=1 Tax=uncultured Rothia sp. TaxID=316088 RepID=UPI0028DCBBBB|nr:NAD(P)-binding oxidoreductase [uncultured Rothia sp.]
MKILVLGATGRTGSLFTRKALEEGHAVTAYVRNPDKALALLGAHQNLTIIPGTLDDAEQLATAASGQDVMVSILGQKATVREFLSSTFMQERLPLIMKTVTGAGVKHCVLMSAYGVGDTVRTASLPMRLACKVIMRGIFTDRVKADALVAEYQPYISRAHPGRLTDKPGRGGVKVIDMAKVERTAGVPTIAREDVADALLAIAENPQNAGTDFLVTIGDAVLHSPQK